MNPRDVAVCLLTACATPAVFAGEVCAPAAMDAPAALQHARADDETIAVAADRITGDGAVVVLDGDAEVVRGRRALFAERIVYQRDTQRADADAVTFYSERGDQLRAQQLTVGVVSGDGVGDGVKIKIADADGEKKTVRVRATAASVKFAGDIQRLTDATLTTCADGNDDVMLRAKKITLDHDAGVGRAKSMTLRFKQVPIFYFPAVTFPLNDERKTGFLFPRAGYDDDSGATLAAPVYFNLAPNLDATLTPKLFGKRGAGLGGEFRYLTEKSRGELRGDALPSDSEYDDDRYALGYRHRHRFNDDWRGAVDWQSVSDRDYLRDFDDDLNLVAASYLPKKASLEFFGEHLNFRARARGYEVADTIARADRPYETLPQLSLTVKPLRVGWLQGALDAHYDRFRHADDDIVDGARWRVKPSLALPLKKSYGYLTPKISLQTIRYALDNDDATDDSPSVRVPIYSLAGGLFFQRNLRATLTQTLEPRLFYANIPYKRAQQTFPDFDTDAGRENSFAHFFRANRFFGGDRVGDTEHLALGVTSRVLDAAGEQRLSFSLGQVFYFADRELGLTATDAATNDSSGVIVQADAAAGNFNFTAFARSDGDATDAARLSVEHGDSERRAAVAYTYHADAAAADTDTEQLNASFAAPAGARWRWHGDAAYSLGEHELRSATLGARYDACCWAVTVSARRYLDGDGAHKNRLALTLELADLGRIGAR